MPQDLQSGLYLYAAFRCRSSIAEAEPEIVATARGRPLGGEALHPAAIIGDDVSQLHVEKVYI